ncbi:hypothetical protein IFM89_010797 [Coptis chinensis]|uniref:Uncharacterized protein n=1 Tax=Coptis chinensis TaxID=261450 RepID=A0A835M590_9MAGN|nr:hypothetical protein IFM89_010797 [Coptis chinensis]
MEPLTSLVPYVDTPPAFVPSQEDMGLPSTIVSDSCSASAFGVFDKELYEANQAGVFLVVDELSLSKALEEIPPHHIELFDDHLPKGAHKDCGASHTENSDLSVGTGISPRVNTEPINPSKASSSSKVITRQGSKQVSHSS